MATNYRVWTTLSTRDAVNPGPDEEVDGTLLVGPEIFTWSDNYSSYGHDCCVLRPAFHNGERVWVRSDSWSPAYGYSASGTSEYIVPFEDGVKILIEKEVFTFPAPVKEPVQ